MWDKVLQFINQLKGECYTGDIKIGIDRGECTSISKANAFDLCTSQIEPEYMPEVLLKGIKNNSNGSVCYRFCDGVITEYAFLWTFKSTTLKGLLWKVADADL